MTHTLLLAYSVLAFTLLGCANHCPDWQEFHFVAFRSQLKSQVCHGHGCCAQWVSEGSYCRVRAWEMDEHGGCIRDGKETGEFVEGHFVGKP